MITEDKVTEIFCMADDFCKFFDAMTAKYTLKPTGKRNYHRNSTMSKTEVMLIMILFHDSGYRYFKHFTKLKSNMKGALMSVSDRLLLRKRAIIETVNDELKNIAQVEHSGYRCFDNFIVNLLGAIAAYCLFPKKPCINVQRTIDTQLALFRIRRTHVNLLRFTLPNLLVQLPILLLEHGKASN